MAYNEELETAIDAAQEAGRIMQKYQRDGFEVERKSAYTDIVTEADVACQEAIIERLHDAFPGDGFLAEEDTDLPNESSDSGEVGRPRSGAKELPPASSGRRWVIDPIDGTNNFSHGFPFYCASIALQVDGETQVGVVYAPALDELFTAVRGEGARRNGEPITVSNVDELRDALVLTRLSSWETTLHDQEHQFLRALQEDQASFRRPGSAAMDLCNVACGRADAHALSSINEWDIAAGVLLVEEAGGTVRVQESVAGDYLEIVDSNGHLQETVEEMFDRNIRSQL